MYSLFPGPAKPLSLLNPWCSFKIIQSVECPKPMEHGPMAVCKYLLLFRLGSVKGAGEEEDKLIGHF